MIQFYYNDKWIRLYLPVLTLDVLTNRIFTIIRMMIYNDKKVTKPMSIIIVISFGLAQGPHQVALENMNQTIISPKEA